MLQRGRYLLLAGKESRCVERQIIFGGGSRSLAWTISQEATSDGQLSGKRMWWGRSLQEGGQRVSAR